MRFLNWLRKVWLAVTRRPRPKPRPVPPKRLGFEALESRETPATFIYLMPGYSSPVGNNGMTGLALDLANDSVLDARVQVIDWEWNRGLINLPLTPAAQTQAASARIRDDLRNQQATAADKVIFVGHSYGGYLAYSLANNVPGMDRPADSLVLIDPIDWRYAQRWWPLLNQSRLQNPLPTGMVGTDVLNFVQRSPFQGWFKPPLFGFSITGAYNEVVLAKGADDRWGTGDDTNHNFIDSDTGANGKRLGIYDTVKSFLYEEVAGRPSPLHATQVQAAPAALRDALQVQFPFVTGAELFKADPAPDTFPEMYHTQGRGLAFSLSASTRGITIDPLPTARVPQEIEISGTVQGWGEAALGNALFRTLKTFAGEMGVERIQWNGRLWSDEYTNELRYVGLYPKDKFFVGFSLDGSQRVEADVYARFMAALRIAWSEEVQLHAGWPVLAVRSQFVYRFPWQMQARIMPESDLAAPERIGRFVVRAAIGDALTKDGTRFNLEIMPVRDRGQADELFPDGRKLWVLPYRLTMPNWRWRGFVIRSNLV